MQRVNIIFKKTEIQETLLSKQRRGRAIKEPSANELESRIPWPGATGGCFRMNMHESMACSYHHSAIHQWHRPPIYFNHVPRRYAPRSLFLILLNRACSRIYITLVQRARIYLRRCIAHFRARYTLWPDFCLCSEKKRGYLASPSCLTNDSRRRWAEDEFLQRDLRCLSSFPVTAGGPYGASSNTIVSENNLRMSFHSWNSSTELGLGVA